MRVFWPVTVAAAALVGLLAYGLVAKGADTTLDEAVANGTRPAAPVASLPWLHTDGRGSLADVRTSWQEADGSCLSVPARLKLTFAPQRVRSRPPHEPVVSDLRRSSRVKGKNNRAGLVQLPSC